MFFVFESSLACNPAEGALNSSRLPIAPVLPFHPFSVDHHLFLIGVTVVRVRASHTHVSVAINHL